MARRGTGTKSRAKRTVSSVGGKDETVNVKFWLRQTGDIEGAMQDLRKNPKAFLGKLTESNMGKTVALISLAHALGEHYFIGRNYCKPIIGEMERQKLIKVDWKHKTFTVLK